MHRAPAAAARNIRNVVGHRFCLLSGKWKLGGCPLQGCLEMLILLEKTNSESSAIFSNFLLIIALLEDMHERG